MKTSFDSTGTRSQIIRIVRVGLPAFIAIGLAACSKLPPGQDEMVWARTALQRNDQLEVVASDPQARTFTVRWKASGALLIIPVSEIVAAPTPARVASANGAVAPAVESASEEALPPTPPQAPFPAPGPNLAPAPPSAAAPTVAAAPTPAPAPASDATAGNILASGPGYTIQASPIQGVPHSASASASSAAATAAFATVSRGAPVERLHDPIICQGSRLLHIDNRNLQFDGDAVTAEDGCEIHITNSHIRAKGVGIVARAADVHIENSEIDGTSGAIDASDGAQIYAETSRFKGLTRRMEASAFHDLGGNVWN